MCLGDDLDPDSTAWPSRDQSSCVSLYPPLTPCLSVAASAIRLFPWGAGHNLHPQGSARDSSLLSTQPFTEMYLGLSPLAFPHHSPPPRTPPPTWPPSQMRKQAKQEDPSLLPLNLWRRQAKQCSGAHRWVKYTFGKRIGEEFHHLPPFQLTAAVQLNHAKFSRLKSQVFIRLTGSVVQKYGPIPSGWLVSAPWHLGPQLRSFQWLRVSPVG